MCSKVTKFIRIGIADKNDNPPYFDKELYEAEVDENEDIQHTVLTVTAKDHDESSRIRYEITSGNIGGAFAVKNMTGAIYVAGALDYETRKRYELKLAASDNLKENYTTVVIHVKDVNDNPPVFERPTYRTQITEEVDRNLPKRVLQVTATDGDKDRQQNIVYFLTGQGIDADNPANSKFDINRTTGEIFVLRPLDRDQPNGRPQWRFTVFAQDEGGEGLVGYADVQVNLKDINDNAPIFPQGVYFGNVTENGTAGMVVMTMTALDYDDPAESNNAKLWYSIEKNVIEEETGSPIFEIEPETGVIKTAVCCLDRERTPDYSIQIVASDGGGLKGTGTASIRVKDINDMPPQFTKDEWFTEVDETDGTNLPEMPILTVTVHDEDETNKFQYKVIENSGYGADKFTMVRNNDGTGSLKIVQPLDYEDQLQSNGFRFRIQVNDKGEDNDNDKYHVAYSWVVVKLRDINDNKPQFDRANIEVSVYENAEVGKSLDTFKATDPDQGGKSKVSYAIDRSSDRKRQFSINQEGTVSIQRSLDREDTPRHQVKILAIDDGVPPRTATATLTVIVQDINDNAPTFLKDYRPVLTEHITPKKVAEILATDDDDRSKSNGPPFQFRLDPGADDIIRASFKVEQDQKGANGDGMAIVSSLRSFDREQQKEYLIPIIIKDHGNPAMTGTSTLTVVIGDVNDNKMQPGSKEILVYNYQGQAPDTEIGRVYVYDLDDWDLPDKKFYWESSEHPNFTLNEETGGKAEYTGVRTFEVYADFQKGCLDDIRLEGKHLPLPPAMNGTQWGQATMARNLDRNCPSNSPCINVHCTEPFVCVDLWNEYECTCGEGLVLSPDGKGCVDKNECLYFPCRNGGTCVNREPGYRCHCPEGFWGENCELVQEGRTLKLSMGALAAILVCLLIIMRAQCADAGRCVEVQYALCRCPGGSARAGGTCVNVNECVGSPCLNGGTCVDREPSRRYDCVCAFGYAGHDCELELLASGIITPSRDFIIAIIVCLFLLLVLVLVFVVYNRRREAHIKYPGPDDDVRENIINYDDEGGGEDDMTAFDITPLQIPIGGPLPDHAPAKLPYPLMGVGLGVGPMGVAIGVPPGVGMPLPGETNVGMFIEEHKRRADSDPNAPPFDDLRNYAYEGGGSTAGSLSSLASGTDDETHEYDYLGAWGPRFDKLADLYGPDLDEQL
ncbi:unnamed protein product, partial [Iphiclides podalirius]